MEKLFGVHDTTHRARVLMIDPSHERLASKVERYYVDYMSLPTPEAVINHLIATVQDPPAGGEDTKWPIYNVTWPLPGAPSWRAP